MSRNKQIWHLDLGEVDRIKAGILRYISINQTTRSKDKYLRTPSTPLTPKKSSRSRLDKSKRQENQFSLSFRLDLQNRQQQGAEMNKPDRSIPKGYYLSEDRKILTYNTLLEQKLENLPQIVIQQPIQIQPKLNSQDNNNANKPEGNQNKQDKNQAEIYSPLQHPSKPQQQQPQSLLNQPQNQQKNVLSVSELAKRFGGLHKQQDEPISNSAKAQSSIQPTARFNIQARSNQRINSQSFDESSKSITSFSKIDKQGKPHRKISDFLNVRMEEKKKEEKQRKRSQTYQDNVEFQIYNSVIKQQNDQRAFQRSNIPESTCAQKTKKEVDQYKFKSMEFTQSQEKELKTKYNALSLKLDALKSRVLEECSDVRSSKNKKNFSPFTQQRILVRLYNKHSPLKNLQRSRENLLKDKNLSKSEARNTKIEVESILRI